MKKLLLALILTSLPLQVSLATGLHQCDSGDQTNWKTPESLKDKLILEGWKVRKIKQDGGCYEVYATTISATKPEGKRAEAYFHPETLELELIARRGQILFKKSK